ncbi:MAG: hypothetical protein LBR81_03585 [Prevotellaceae bacterium]|jgi:hypothetical protein|nr:hypothetical protein [Prevotellaceae bacterium]
MKKFISNIVLIFALCGVAQAQYPYSSPYDMFNSEQETTMVNDTIEMWMYHYGDTLSIYGKIEFNKDSDVTIFHSNNDSILLKPLMVVKWNVDPHAGSYPDLSPYAFVANTPIRAIDPDGRDIYILFATTGNHRGNAMISAAARTRERNIKNNNSFDPSKDKVVVLRVKDMAQIKTMVEQTVATYSAKYGNTKEVGVYSHGGWQGPTGSVPPSQNAVMNEDGTSTQQMTPEGWAKIDFNWVDNGASFTMYGCNTGNDIKGNEWVGSFARTVSTLPNFDNVQVAGQSSSAYPSFYPAIRETNALRSTPKLLEFSLFDEMSFSVGNTYMVGGNAGEGLKSTQYMKGSPSANPLNVYKNGEKIGSGYQSPSLSNPLIY